MKSLRIPAILASGILLLSALPQVDLQARAVFANPKSTSVTISVDGTASDLTPTWIDSGVAKEAAFGGGDIGGAGTKELTTMYTTKSSGGTSRALLRNMAQGGVEEISCAVGYVNGAGVATSKEYYQRSQVTLGNLPTDAAKRVWAFYDANVGSGSGIKEIPHFNHVAGAPDIENARIAATANLTKLCDGTTPFVVKADDSAFTTTRGTLGLGNNVRTTAGVYQDLGSSAASVSFNVYVPMNAMNSNASTIQLALGFVVDVNPGTLADPTVDVCSDLHHPTRDVAIETTIYAKPWWATAHEGAGHSDHPEHDEVHQILPACSSPAANAAPCVIQADSGVFETDGTTRLDAGATTGTSVVLTWLGDAENFEARLDLAPISPISTGGFSVPADKVSRISVSWPTSGTHYGAAFGSGDDQVNFLLAIADTPVLVNPASSASDANKWSVTESSSRIITTLNGTTRSTSIKTKEEAKKTADSVYALVRNSKSKFTEIADEINSDGTKGKGGDIGWVRKDQAFSPSFDSDFADFIYKNKVGSIQVVETAFGFHIIRIDNQKNKQKVLKLATFSRKIVPSEATENVAFRNAEEFALAVSKENMYFEVALGKNYKPKPAVGLKALDENVVGLGSQRQIVRWAFGKETKVNDFKRFDLEGSHVVVFVTNATEKGLMSAAKATNRVRPILVNEKKAALINEKLQGASLSDIATANNTTVKSANGITLKNVVFSILNINPIQS